MLRQKEKRALFDSATASFPHPSPAPLLASSSSHGACESVWVCVTFHGPLARAAYLDATFCSVLDMIQRTQGTWTHMAWSALPFRSPFLGVENTVVLDELVPSSLVVFSSRFGTLNKREEYFNLSKSIAPECRNAWVECNGDQLAGDTASYKDS